MFHAPSDHIPTLDLHARLWWPRTEADMVVLRKPDFIYGKPFMESFLGLGVISKTYIHIMKDVLHVNVLGFQ